MPGVLYKGTQRLSPINVIGGNGDKLILKKTKDVNDKITFDNTTPINIDGATNIDDYVFHSKYYNNTLVSGSVDFSSLQIIDGDEACYNMFSGCTGITSVDMSNLTSVNGYKSCQSMFGGCSSLASVNISSLTNVTGNDACMSMFANCTSLTSVDLSSLQTISGSSGCKSLFFMCSGIQTINISNLQSITGDEGLSQAFYSCQNLTSVRFDSLDNISASGVFNAAFRGCSSLTDIYFPALTTSSFGSYNDQFKLGTTAYNAMLYGTSNVILHFPSSLQSIIPTLNGYNATNPFGSTNGSILYDL